MAPPGLFMAVAPLKVISGANAPSLDTTEVPDPPDKAALTKGPPANESPYFSLFSPLARTTPSAETAQRKLCSLERRKLSKMGARAFFEPKEANICGFWATSWASERVWAFLVSMA